MRFGILVAAALLLPVSAHADCLFVPAQAGLDCLRHESDAEMRRLDDERDRSRQRMVDEIIRENAEARLRSDLARQQREIAEQKSEIDRLWLQRRY